jgi:hypothetical protein
MTLPVETFQDRAARRRAPKDLREGRDALNDLIRQGRPTLVERDGVRVMQGFEQREQEFEQRQAEIDAREPSPPPNDANAARAAGLDQGSRGGGHSPGAHAPTPTGGSGALRQALREAREARGGV